MKKVSTEAVTGSSHSRSLPRVARRSSALGAGLLATALISAQAQPDQTQQPFPDSEALIQRVAQHQKEVESRLSQYTFTDTITVYTLDKKGQVRNQHTDIYYVTPTAYEFFALHISHDGKSVPESDLRKQEKEIQHKMLEDEKKAQKPGELHPKDTILFTDIILRSRFTPLRWDGMQGQRMIVYAFEPKAPVQSGGELGGRLAGI